MIPWTPMDSDVMRFVIAILVAVGTTVAGAMAYAHSQFASIREIDTLHSILQTIQSDVRGIRERLEKR